MVGSDPVESMGVAGRNGGQESSTDGDAGWALVAGHDGAAALIGATLRLDAESEFTRSDLSDVSDVAYKTIYLDETVDALVDAGLLERVERDAEEAAFRVDHDSPVYEAAATFDEAVASDQQSDAAGERTP